MAPHHQPLPQPFTLPVARRATAAAAVARGDMAAVADKDDVVADKGDTTAELVGTIRNNGKSVHTATNHTTASKTVLLSRMCR